MINKTLLIPLLFSALSLSAKDLWKSQPNWLTLPADREKVGNMHGDIAVSSNGDVYVSVGDPKAGLQVYGDNGKWKRNVPNAPSDLHGFVIKKEGKQELALNCAKAIVDKEVKIPSATVSFIKQEAMNFLNESDSK